MLNTNAMYRNVLLLLLLAPGSSNAQVPNVTFRRYQEFNVGRSCCEVVTGDFNRDGKSDLVARFATGVSLFLADGTGGFKSPMPVRLFSAQTGKMIVADMNRDGMLDLVIGSALFLGNGDGTFKAETPTLGVGDADFNGDGILDLLRHGPTSDCGYRIQLGKGDGSFSPPGPCIPDPDGNLRNSLVGDFNSDGRPDLMVASIRGGPWVWLALGNGDGTLRRFVEVDIGYGNFRSMCAADFDRDGRLDLAVGGGPSGNISITTFGRDGSSNTRLIFEEDDLGLLAPVNVISSIDFGDLACTDVNGDGIADLAFNQVILPGKGDGTFLAPIYVAVGWPHPHLAATADFDGDGKADLVFVVWPPNDTTLRVLFSKANLVSTTVAAFSSANSAPFLASASLGSIYGRDLAASTVSAQGPVPPVELGGISLQVRDQNDTVRLASLYFVSPSQINFVVPPDLPPGTASFTIRAGSNSPVESALAVGIRPLSPGFLAADGIPAAAAVRVSADGGLEDVPIVACDGGTCSLRSIDNSHGPVYLSLYGTGFRSAKLPSRPGDLPRCTVGGQDAKIQFLGAHGIYPGLDQLNLLLPSSLPAGKADIQCEFSRQLSNRSPLFTNTVQISIR